MGCMAILYYNVPKAIFYLLKVDYRQRDPPRMSMDVYMAMSFLAAGSSDGTLSPKP